VAHAVTRGLAIPILLEAAACAKTSFLASGWKFVYCYKGCRYQEVTADPSNLAFAEWCAAGYGMLSKGTFGKGVCRGRHFAYGVMEEDVLLLI
jgi:hypothetical protein